MGYMRHHAIVVTSWDDKAIEEARKGVLDIATQIEGLESPSLSVLVSPIVGSLVNGYASFLIAPDGSKDGWGDSDAGDEFRNRVVTYFVEQAEKLYLDWAEVQFGDDNHVNRLLRTNDEPEGEATAVTERTD